MEKRTVGYGLSIYAWEETSTGVVWTVKKDADDPQARWIVLQDLELFAGPYETKRAAYKVLDSILDGGTIYAV